MNNKTQNVEEIENELKLIGGEDLEIEELKKLLVSGRGKKTKKKPRICWFIKILIIFLVIVKWVDSLLIINESIY